MKWTYKSWGVEYLHKLSIFSVLFYSLCQELHFTQDIELLLNMLKYREGDRQISTLETTF